MKDFAINNNILKYIQCGSKVLDLNDAENSAFLNRNK